MVKCRGSVSHAGFHRRAFARGAGALTDDLKHGQARPGAGDHDGAGEPRWRRAGDEFAGQRATLRTAGGIGLNVGLVSCRTARFARW